jgi:hypothetical protein
VCTLEKIERQPAARCARGDPHVYDCFLLLHRAAHEAYSSSIPKARKKGRLGLFFSKELLPALKIRNCKINY